MLRPRALAVATAVAVVCATALVHPFAEAAGSVAGEAAEPVPTRTVTLITGDRVTVRGPYAATVEPGPGRTGMQFLTRRVGDHVSVIPADALSLLSSGHLDNRLFDVTTLIASGYDDSRPDLRLIVTHSADAREITLQDVTSGGGRMMRDLPSVRGMAVEAQKATATRLWDAITSAAAGSAPRVLDDGIEKIWLDGLRQPALDESVPQVGAPAAWAAGYDGTGVSVAVLDTGIDAAHPDLAGKVATSSNFTEGTEGDGDLVGHGTHVASTVAGAGSVYKGVAPGARLLDGKVCAKSGCAESWVLAGMEWAASRAKVVNMSLGGPDTAEQDPVEQALQNLTAEHGTLFVVASGNTAPALPVNSPASADAALAVGAVDGSGQLANFSAVGPRVGDAAVKPDITAPGVNITAARSSTASVGTPGEAYFTESGTSMASPHVAGGAAILAQQHPGWAAAQLKGALMTAAAPNPSLDAFEQGSGRLDLAKAITQTVTATPASLSFGRHAWPHDDDTPVAKTVTFSNSGTAAVTLSLAVSGGSTFTVDRTSVAVPAGGTAEATVTADTRVSTSDGFLFGALTATGEGAQIRIPFAVDREVESYPLTVSHIGIDGQPAGDFLTVVSNWDGSFTRTVPAGGTVRVPRGSYAVMGVVTSQLTFAVLAQPRLEVTGTQTVTLDARLGQPVSVTVPAADATAVFSEASLVAALAGSTVEVGTLGGNFTSVRVAQMGPSQAVDGFASRLSQTFSAGSDAYLLSWYNRGRVPDGFTRDVAAADLATVRADHAGQTTDTEGRKAAWASLPDIPSGGFAAALPFALPSVRTEFYNTDSGGRWGRSLDEVVPGAQPQYVTSTVAPFTTYGVGRTYQESWNRGVFGPTVATPQTPELWVTRTGNQMRVMSPLYGDGLGRAGYSAIATGSVAIYRNGSEVVSSTEPRGDFTVPAESGEYRVEIVSSRPAPAELSTQVSVTWTFSSGHVAGDDPVRLPVSTVQFTPPVDNENTAPAGETATIPVSLQSQPDSSAGALRTLTVQVSYDDGRTWETAPLLDNPRRAQVTHPAAAGFVSLRATAEDSAGNTVTQTVIRAYRIT